MFRNWEDSGVINIHDVLDGILRLKLVKYWIIDFIPEC